MRTFTKTSAVLAAFMALSAGAAFAQDNHNLPTPRDYYGLYQGAGEHVAASRADRIDYDLSGVRGRNGLGADPIHPEGAGNVAD